MQINTQVTAIGSFATLHGELDVSTSEVVAQELQIALRLNQRDILMHVGGVTQVSVSALRILLSFVEQMQKQKRRIYSF